MKNIVIAVTLLFLSACQTVPPCSVVTQDDTNKVHLDVQPLQPLDLTAYKSVTLTVDKNQVVSMSEDDYSKLSALINTLSGRIESLQNQLTSYKTFYEAPAATPTATPAK